jgi:tRNA threonylcarbamoyladenosine biosynthesis protein TsaB
MIALGIDTCERACSAAIVSDGQILSSKQEDIGRGHAERLLPMLEELYLEASITEKDINKIGVTVGPGTFTGLRIGLSVARGLAFALNIPCIGISALEVLAHQAKGVGTVHAVIAGRGEHCFYQPFYWSEGRGEQRPANAAANLSLTEVKNLIEDKSGYIIGSGVEQLGFSENEHVNQAFCDPTIIAQLATQKAAKEYRPDPLYLRAPDAAKAKPVFASEALKTTKTL